MHFKKLFKKSPANWIDCLLLQGLLVGLAKKIVNQLEV